MKIIPLSEGAFTVDKTKRFIPFDLQKDQLQQRPTGSLLVEIQPFAIVTSRDILLLDTGLGFMTNNVMQIHQNLMNNGINPGEVTKVLMTHLHKDHAGGITKQENRIQRSLSFPDATYYVNRQEFEFALEKGSASYTLNDFEILKDA